MKRVFALLLTAALLSGCGAPADAPSDPAPAPAPTPSAKPAAPSAITAEDAAAAYDRAESLAFYFTVTTLEVDSGDSRDFQGMAYCRVSDPAYPGLTSLSALRALLRQSFSESVTDALLAENGAYRDFDGVLYAAPGARGTDILQFDRTVEAVPVSDTRWDVTITFWADFPESGYAAADGTFRAAPVDTIGYSQTTLPYEWTDGGWCFTDFCAPDALDSESNTVFTFRYEEILESGAYEDFSDLQLSLYLIHADGAYAEAPADLFLHRFLSRPEEVLAVIRTLYPAWQDSLHRTLAFGGAGWLYGDEARAFPEILKQSDDPAAAQILAYYQSALDSY